MNHPSGVDQPTVLLGGLSPRGFMRRHWHKRPLLVRGAVPGVQAPLARAALFELASREGVESRLVVQDAGADPAWRLRRGPLPRRALPAASQAGWTLLVQGLDLHVPAARELLARFRFLPQARLDDLMLSWASAGGGVGPHVDSYDVFLLQVQGRRRWRFGPPGSAALRPDLPLKILARFEPTEEHVLGPGDMLYLPPGWAHEGIAEGECMTASIGFRAPLRAALGADLLVRMAEAEADDIDQAEDSGEHGAHRVLYRDASQAATAEPGRVPAALQDFAADAVARALRRRGAVTVALGEALTEPRAQQEFAGEAAAQVGEGVALAPGTRMLYDDTHVFINGESWRAAGRDARLLRRLADHQQLDAPALAQASADALALLGDWLEAGWLAPITEP